MRKTTLRRIGACLLLVTALGFFSGCSGKGMRAHILSDGWLVRSDGSGEGENEKWFDGFGEEQADGDESAENVWYCNTFTAALAAEKNDRVILSLTDIGESVSVWFNGKNVGEHEGACGRFDLDVTDAVKASGKNILVVRKTGAGAGAVEHTSISVRPRVMITDMMMAADAATGAVTFSVVLDSVASAPVNVTLEAVLTAPAAGKTMAGASAEVTASKGESVHTVTLAANGHINWNSVNPYLYGADVTVRDGGSIDSASASVGFCDFAVDNEGFFLMDGERFLLRTADLPVNVMYDEAAMRGFVDYVRVIGFNAVRPAGAPATQALMNYCDKVGMLVENSADAADADLLAQQAALTAKSASGHVSFALLDLYIAGAPAGKADAAAALAGVREYNAAAAVLCGGASGKAGDTIALSAPGTNGFDAEIGGSGASYVSVCAGMALPESMDAAKLDAWYAECALDALYPTAPEAYEDIQKQYVAQAEEEIRALRSDAVLAGISFAGGITSYPPSMIEVLNDSLNDLRFCIEADDCVYAGVPFRLRVSLSDMGVLWNRAFSVCIKITGAAGTVYENTLPLTLTFDDDGHAAQITEILDEEITLGAPTGEYVISAEFTNLAHPTCGTRSLCVVDTAEALTAGTVYVSGVSEAVTELLTGSGATPAGINGDIPANALIVAAGKLPAAVTAAVDKGARLVVLDAGADSGLPVDLTFSQGMSGMIFSKDFTPPFAGSMRSDGLGLEMGAFSGGECETLVTAYGVPAADGIAGGKLIGVFGCGAGRVCVSACDLDAAAGTPAADALILGAINAVA